MSDTERFGLMREFWGGIGFHVYQSLGSSESTVELRSVRASSIPNQMFYRLVYQTLGKEE